MLILELLQRCLGMQQDSALANPFPSRQVKTGCVAYCRQERRTCCPCLASRLGAVAVGLRAAAASPEAVADAGTASCSKGKMNWWSSAAQSGTNTVTRAVAGSQHGRLGR